jgi:epoxyqueuosine reductase
MSNNLRELTRQVKHLAKKQGFHKVGIASADNPTHSQFLSTWLEKKYNGTMYWMKSNLDKRLNIQNLFFDTKSVICVAHNYFTPYKHVNSDTIGKISRYAWGEDYHKIIKKKLKILLSEIKKLNPAIWGKICVDTSPIMEKLWGVQAGIGWQGKHTNLITRDFGSWVFLGEILLNIKLNYDTPINDYCGSCTACIDACPTQAIVKPYILDGTKCISYLTIENRNQTLQQKYAGIMNNWIFGCDICQDVCPWNKYQQITDEKRYFPEPKNIKPSLTRLVKITEREFKRHFEKSPIFRTGWQNIIRNIKFIFK